MTSISPAISKTKAARLRALVKQRLQLNRRAGRLVPPDPAPRYDEVFAMGQRWLDQLAAEEVEP